MIKIYSLYFNENSDLRTLEHLYPLLSPKAVQHLGNLHLPKDRFHCALGELLAKYAISETFKILPYNINFFVNKYGKPFVKDNESIHFNLSHSAQRIVCAVSSHPVGIDMERINDIDILAITKEVFSKDEFDFLSRLSSNERLEAFFKLWTMKESYIKLLGCGLTHPLNSFTIKLKSPGTTSERPIRIQSSATGECLAYVKQYDMDPSYKLSVCQKQNLFDDYIIHLNYNPSSSNIKLLCSPKDGGGSMALSCIFSR